MTRRPSINGISIESEIRAIFGVLQLKICSSDHKAILHSYTVVTCAKSCCDGLGTF